MYKMLQLPLRYILMLSVLDVQWLTKTTIIMASATDHTSSESCGLTEFYQNTGIIRSPYYPKNYPNNTRCIYSVQRSRSGPTLLRSTHFALEQEANCRYDYLRIYAGVLSSHLVESFCGKNRINVVVNSSYITMEFNSDESNTFSGFEIRFEDSVSTTMEKPATFYCPVGYIAIDPNREPNMGDKCFKFVYLDQANGIGWSEAERRCRSGPGRMPDIASIHGPYEHEFVRSQTASHSFHLWIGLYMVSGGQGWAWLDNSEFTSEDANWMDGEPTGDGGVETCGEVYLKANSGKWNDAPCDYTYGYICQTHKDPYNPSMDPPAPHQKDCPEGYTPYHYGCYRLLNNTRKSWMEMRDDCRSHSKESIKSDLVSIHSSAEDAALHIKVMYLGASVWTGLKENEDNSLEWSNGWYPLYTNWAPNEPTDLVHLGCVAMHNGPGGGWYKIDCNTPLAAICEIMDEEPIKAPLLMNGSCPEELYGTTPWLKHGSHCYLPVVERKSWDNASRHCTQLGSTLVSILSYFENEFVYENMQKHADAEWGWIGLHRSILDDKFYWTDGGAFQYERWLDWQPNNYRGKQDCVTISTKESSYWNDAYCSEQFPFMCKVEQGPPIQPPRDHPEPCSDGWHKFGAFCYLPFPHRRMWWHDAEENCQREGGSRAHLPTITNKFQEEFLYNIMAEAPAFYWIGLHQRRGVSMYHWVGTGDKYDPRGFHRGHIQSNMTMELCVAATNNQSTKARLWKTVHCDQLATYVCEIPLNTAMPRDNEGDNMAIAISVSLAIVGVGIIAIIVVILVRNGNTLSNGDNGINERDRTTPVVQYGAAGAPFSWGTGERDIYLTTPEHGDRKTPGTSNKAYGASFSKTTGIDKCTVYTTRPSQLQYANTPPEEHMYEFVN